MIALCCKADLGRHHRMLPARRVSGDMRPKKNLLFWEVTRRWALACGLILGATLVLTTAMVLALALALIPSRLNARARRW